MVSGEEPSDQILHFFFVLKTFKPYQRGATKAGKEEPKKKASKAFILFLSKEHELGYLREVVQSRSTPLDL